MRGDFFDLNCRKDTFTGRQNVRKKDFQKVYTLGKNKAGDSYGTAKKHHTDRRA